VEEVKAGMSVGAISRKYGIGGAATVKQWVLRYGDPQMLNEVIYVKMRSETDQVKALQKEVQRSLAPGLGRDKFFGLLRGGRVISVAQDSGLAFVAQLKDRGEYVCVTDGLVGLFGHAGLDPSF
jgi:hypothetical protein